MASGAFKIVGLLALVATATSASAATVYQHSGSGNFSYTSGSEYGDEILLQGWERVISGFSFEYAANYALSSGLTFRIYDQTGPVIGGAASPGAVLYETVIDIQNGGGVVSIDFGNDPTNLANLIPDRLTYTVKFSGLLPGNTAGLIAPGGNPVIGLSASDFWEKTGPGANDWALKAINGPSGNFIATVTAVPEPSTVAMMAAGVGMILVALRRK